jgi:hypothetical protein
MIGTRVVADHPSAGLRRGCERTMAPLPPSFGRSSHRPGLRRIKPRRRGPWLLRAALRRMAVLGAR